MDWWCFLLIRRGGAAFSVTWVGAPPLTWVYDLEEHFGDYVIIDPPVIIENA